MKISFADMMDDDDWDEETANIPDPVHRKADQLSQNELSIELERRDLKLQAFGLTMPKNSK